MVGLPMRGDVDAEFGLLDPVAGVHAMAPQSILYPLRRPSFDQRITYSTAAAMTHLGPASPALQSRLDDRDVSILEDPTSADTTPQQGYRIIGYVTPTAAHQ